MRPSGEGVGRDEVVGELRGAGGQGLGAVVLFVAMAGISGLSGVGERVLGGTPFVQTLPEYGVVLLRGWMAGAAVVSLVLPVVALAIWGRHRGVRRALVPYLLVLVAQILVEFLFVSFFFPNVVVLTGLAFTTCRVGQLVSARRAFVGEAGRYGQAFVGGVLSLGLVFWSANLVFLAFVALPRVVQSA